MLITSLLPPIRVYVRINIPIHNYLQEFWMSMDVDKTLINLYSIPLQLQPSFPIQYAFVQEDKSE